MRTSAAALGVLFLLGAAGATRGQHDFHDIHGFKGEAVPKLNYDSLASEAVPLEESEDGRALLEACLARYGGDEALRKIEGLRMTWSMSVMGGDAVEVVKSLAGGRRYRFRSPRETRVLNGSRAWFENADTRMELDGGRYNAELFSYLTLSMPLALRDEEFGGGIRYGTREDGPLGYLYLEKPDTLMIVIGIDPEDSLIKTSEGVVRQGEDSFVFINRFSDHIDIEGVPIPHRLVNVSMGLVVGDSRLQGVEVNPEFAADEFGP